MKAIILAAGAGSRMHPLGVTRPKLLMPIFNRPLIEHQLEAIIPLVDEVIYVIGNDPFGRQIQQYIAQRTWPVSINFAIQPSNGEGTGFAVQSAKDLIPSGQRLLILYGDDLYSAQDFSRLNQQEYGILGHAVEDWEKWGIIQPNPEGHLQSVVEKPDQFIGNLANTGAYILSSDIFDLYHQTTPSVRGEHEFTDTVTLFAQKHKVAVLKIEDYWLPIGYPWHILETHQYLANRQKYHIDGHIEDGVTIRGQLSLGAGSVIKSGCYIEGHVTIGKNCVIGPNAYLRGATVIGNDTYIGFSVEVNNSTLFGQTKIPHFNFVGHSILGSNARFAAGAVTADRRFDRQNVHTMVKGELVSTQRAKFGTVMGDNSYLGCNSVVYPGRKIWPDQNVLPGHIVDQDIVESDSTRHRV